MEFKWTRTEMKSGKPRDHMYLLCSNIPSRAKAGKMCHLSPLSHGWMMVIKGPAVEDTAQVLLDF